ncbi:MAG: hypothetical protein Q9191_000069 [Dirinaria sp. TL-2023a]
MDSAHGQSFLLLSTYTYALRNAHGASDNLWLLKRFNVLHPEKLPSAQERYDNEVKRILGVLERSLTGKQWLVGEKCTFADLAFVTWNERLGRAMGVPDSDPLKEDSFKKALQCRDKLMDEQGLMPNGMPKGVNNIAEYEAKIKAEEGA